jgi:hypothetical protein
MIPQTDPESRQLLIEICKKNIKVIAMNSMEPNLIAECERILKEFDKDPLSYDIFNHKKTHGFFESWVEE